MRRFWYLVTLGALWVLPLLVGYDVVMRFFFSKGSVAIQELQWHLYSFVFLQGLWIALISKSHVRVDLLYGGFSSQAKKAISVASYLFAGLPFALLVLVTSAMMAWQSWLQLEGSPNPGGLGYWFVIKAFATMAFGFVCFYLGYLAYKTFGLLSAATRKRFVLIAALLGGLLFASWYGVEYYIVEPIFLMIALVVVLLMLGFEVGFVFGGVALLFALLSDSVGVEIFEIYPYRLFGVMQNSTLVAIPLFIMMGLILQKSQIAKGLMQAFVQLMGSLYGGLGFAVVVVGALLGASTGIVGASVVMMSLIALPMMLKQGYSQSLASGIVVASGTLGQIIPPSIVLIVLGDQMHISVGDLFKAAIVPGLLLVFFYLVYVLVYGYFHKPAKINHTFNWRYYESTRALVGALLLPLLLIGVVLGSIFAGLVSPSESAAIGVIGSALMAWARGRFDRKMVYYVLSKTVRLNAMIFMVLLGATAFSLVFNALGGEEIALSFFVGSGFDKSQFLLLSMGLIFILGFFVDFIEIAFVVVPILAPVALKLGVDPLWFAVLIALNLQTSFLTPPFGFALFYLKGVAKDTIATSSLYKGVLPFILLQLLVVLIVALYPQLLAIGG